MAKVVITNNKTEKQLVVESNKVMEALKKHPELRKGGHTTKLIQEKPLRD